MITETRTIEIVGENGVLGHQSVLPAPEFDHFPPSIATKNRLQEKLVTAFWVLEKIMSDEAIGPKDVPDYINYGSYPAGQKPHMDSPEVGAVIKGVYECSMNFFTNPKTGGTDIYFRPEKDEDGKHPDDSAPIKLALSKEAARLFLGGKGKWQEVPDNEYDDELLNLLSIAQIHMADYDDMEDWREAIREVFEKREDDDLDGY